MFKVGIIGATGYVGVELLRILLNHPKVTVNAISSISFKGESISSIYNNFLNKTNIICESEDDVINKCDIIFTALPHGLSENIANKCINSNKLFIDLGADFRLKDEASYEEWYGKSFSHKKLHKYSVYGLPELNKKRIRESKIIANPGCYPTSISIALLPLLKHSLINLDNIICDCKSGTTGAGRGLSLKTHYAEVNENFSPYNIGGHRHTPEIEETLSEIAREKVNITFTPHLLPINRGIISTIYCTPKGKINLNSLYSLYKENFLNEPFVEVLPLGQTASIKNIKYTNNCHVSLHLNHRKDQLIIVSTIDNMVKGAAGQAIQNMNLLLNLDETTGLNYIAPAF